MKAVKDHLPADADRQGELWEELKVEHSWFHVVRSMILRGTLREMGDTAWTVYCIIKAHTNFDTGNSDPGIVRIANLLGKSTDTVERALKKLIQLDIVTVEKRGKSNRYTLKESIPITTPSGEVFGSGERQYAPMRFKGFVDELVRFAQTGAAPKDQNITINVTFNVQNINQGDGGTVTMNVQSVQVKDGESKTIESADLQNTLKSLRFIDGT